MTYSAGARVARFLFALLFVEMLLLAVRQKIVGELKVDVAKVTGQQELLAILVEARKVVKGGTPSTENRESK